MTIETHIKAAGLTQEERDQLTGFEEVIAEGMTTFVEVGSALGEIRNRKLYRDSHAKFEDYCQDRWGITAGRARQLTTAANIAREVQSATSVALPTESAARAAARIPQPKRNQAVAEAAKSGKVTAPAIEKAAKGPPPKQKKAEPLIDPAGREYDHPRVAEALGYTGKFDDLVNRINAVKRDVAKLAEHPVGKELRAQQIATDLKNATTAIRFAKPYTTCPYARSHGDRGCELCDGSNWVTKEQWERVPEEDK